MRKKKRKYTKRVKEMTFVPDKISQENLSKLAYLAAEVDSIFSHRNINIDTLKIELDTDDLARVWKLIFYIYALEEKEKTTEVPNDATLLNGDRLRNSYKQE